jgi:hypothetical protein
LDEEAQVVEHLVEGHPQGLPAAVVQPEPVPAADAAHREPDEEFPLVAEDGGPPLVLGNPAPLFEQETLPLFSEDGEEGLPQVRGREAKARQGAGVSRALVELLPKGRKEFGTGHGARRVLSAAGLAGKLKLGQIPELVFQGDDGTDSRRPVKK